MLSRWTDHLYRPTVPRNVHVGLCRQPSCSPRQLPAQSFDLPPVCVGAAADRGLAGGKRQQLDAIEVVVAQVGRGHDAFGLLTDVEKDAVVIDCDNGGFAALLAWQIYLTL